MEIKPALQLLQAASICLQTFDQKLEFPKSVIFYKVKELNREEKVHLERELTISVRITVDTVGDDRDLLHQA